MPLPRPLRSAAAALLLAACAPPPATPAPAPAETQARAAADTVPGPIRYGETVTLRGTLDTLQRFGPPGYGDNPGSDERLTLVVLRLDAPIDVHAGDTTDEAPESGVREVQLALPDDLRPTARRVGMRADVKGVPYHRATGYHHTQVLLSVTALRLLPAETPGATP
jgi:hypothetical protein